MSKSFFKLISFDNNILVVLSNRHQLETLKFKIVSQSSELINGVLHTKLLSHNNDIFFILNNKFHREDDQPAVICTLNIFSSQNKTLKKSICKMWFKNGFFHRNHYNQPFKMKAFLYSYHNPKNNLNDFFINFLYHLNKKISILNPLC